ncbi:hypothetical protein PoB_007496300 [Plakobranchus ocellatus]|uniref:Uncharacterized protein n=1 Tax=Plakobranchus ocellatus TaxID=259542 RepID=A0AAV4DWI7_9GAST|nr:hypothetical protein PoB_007496300 [Plakobranchus ocellatus]
MSGGSSGRVVHYHVRGPRIEPQSWPNQFLIATLCPPRTELVFKSLKTRRKIKEAKIAMATFLRMLHAKKNQELGSPTPVPGMGLTLHFKSIYYL